MFQAKTLKFLMSDLLLQFVIISLTGGGLLMYGGYKFFTEGKDKKEEVHIFAIMAKFELYGYFLHHADQQETFIFIILLLKAHAFVVSYFYASNHSHQLTGLGCIVCYLYVILLR